MTKISFTNSTLDLTERKEFTIAQVEVTAAGTKLAFTDNPSTLVDISASDITKFGFVVDQKVAIEPFQFPDHSFSLELIPAKPKATKSPAIKTPNKASPTTGSRLHNGWDL